MPGGDEEPPAESRCEWEDEASDSRGKTRSCTGNPQTEHLCALGVRLPWGKSLRCKASFR